MEEVKFFQIDIKFNLLNFKKYENLILIFTLTCHFI
jgi:hypothetical protein